MSHFTVMVINTKGDNDVDEQLNPYSEHIEVVPYICRGLEGDDDPEWLRFRDFYTSKESTDYSKPRLPDGKHSTRDLSHNKYLSNEELYVKYGTDWNENAWEKDPETGEWVEYTTYNPKSKWDWYEIGGRWCGFLKVKDVRGTPEINPSWGWTTNENATLLEKKRTSNVSDQAINRNILWEDMMLEGYEKGIKHFDEVADICGLDDKGHIKQPLYSWQDCINMNEGTDKYDMDMEGAREIWHEQEEVKNFNKCNTGFFSKLSDYDCTREEYGKRSGGNSISTFAVLKNGVWYEQGEMGWWGMSSETDEEREKWGMTFYNKFIKDLPKDALITIVDCHI